MSTQVATTNPFALMAGRLTMEPAAVESLMRNTLMKAKNNGQVSNEELMVFMSIANEYKLNPLSKEIYAFNNRGAIQPIVSIDGWLKIINQHPQFDGMEFQDHAENGQLQAVTCRIFRKDRSRATEVTEYMSECRGTSEPWKKWPARMLRHKAAIQAARYAFGLSGIIDPDEADRIEVAVRAEAVRTAGPSGSALDSALRELASAASLEELKDTFAKAWRANPAGQGALKEAYDSRKAELESVVATQEPEPEIACEQQEPAPTDDLGWTDEDLGLTEGGQDDIPGI